MTCDVVPCSSTLCPVAQSICAHLMTLEYFFRAPPGRPIPSVGTLRSAFPAEKEAYSRVVWNNPDPGSRSQELPSTSRSAARQGCFNVRRCSTPLALPPTPVMSSLVSNRVAIALRGSLVLDPALSLCSGFLKDTTDWRRRKAGLLTLLVISEVLYIPPLAKCFPSASGDRRNASRLP